MQIVLQYTSYKIQTIIALLSRTHLNTLSLYFFFFFSLWSLIVCHILVNIRLFFETYSCKWLEFMA